MVGSGVAGNGGRVILGTPGMVGSVGFGKAVGIWALGSGGNVVGIVGSGCGWVAWGTVGIAGIGGSATLGNAGIVGMVGVVVWSRFRAPRLVWMVEKDRTMMRERTKLEAAIV
ncbi:hypothetical protein RHMOL_Rhmol08G0018000 [Rhododendron molle]|uniref:Uncharacterized protein n=1 Tax=Rhododendron molle TaxID=49168 RepID=A0ACC0MIR8_RHOML|nr:hypothetical protein RHMOL_Rhmol08G0018000 [Rhododendron molle]